MKALDAHTVLVPMTSPYGSFLDQLSYWYYLYVVPTTFDPKKPNGTGPFKYQSFTPGQRSVFARNGSYWKSGLPYVDSLTIIDFSDSTALQNALTTGVIQGAGALEGPQIAALKSSPAVNTVTSHTGAITPFTMRVDQAPFNDVNVRQAMRLLVDRQQKSRTNSALDGFGSVGADVSSPDDPNYDTSLHRDQDIAQAKRLLQKAGHENLTVQLVTSAVATGTVAMATVLQQQAKAAGVTINLKQVDPSTFFGPNYLQVDLLPGLLQLLAVPGPGGGVVPADVPVTEMHWSQSQYGNLYHQANVTTSASVRKEIEHQMQLIDFNQGGYIIPAFIDVLDAYSTKITGYVPAGSASRFPTSTSSTSGSSDRGEEILMCQLLCLPPDWASPRARWCWPTAGSCSATAIRASCSPGATGTCRRSRGPSARRRYPLGTDGAIYVTQGGNVPGSGDTSAISGIQRVSPDGKVELLFSEVAG